MLDFSNYPIRTLSLVLLFPKIYKSGDNLGWWQGLISLTSLNKKPIPKAPCECRSSTGFGGAQVRQWGVILEVVVVPIGPTTTNGVFKSNK